MKAASILALAVALCRAQGTWVPVAGTGAATFSGDGGAATSATLSNPLGLAVDNAGGFYITDLGNYRVRKVNAAGIINTVAGKGQPGITGDGGPAVNAQLFSILSPGSDLQGIAVDAAGNLYITDSFNHRVRKVDPSGIISLFAGGGGLTGDGGLATKANLGAPTGVAVDGAGNVYIADSLGSRVRKVDTAGIITTVAGTGMSGVLGDGGPATSADIGVPLAIALDAAGNLYINSYTTGRIRKVNTAGIISTYAGNGTTGHPPSGDGGPATGAVLGNANGLAVDGAGNLYFTDSVRVSGGSSTPAVRKVDTSGVITAITIPNGQITSLSDVAVDNAGNIYVITVGRVFKLAAAAPPPPVVSSVVNGASFQPGVAANSWVTIKGSNLASQTGDWSNAIVNGKLPATLNGVSVSIGGKPAYIYFTSPGQLNVLAPDLSPGPVTVTVTTSGGTSSGSTATASQYGPAFFPWPANQPVATRQDFSFAVKPGTFPGATTVAAKPGDVIILWATGFGPTNPAAPAGVAVPSDKIYGTATSPTVTINGSAVIVFGAALAPGSAGVYQIAIQVPNTLADGDYPIQASIGGVQSPTGIILSVHQQQISK
jgi:uncharacterized protein (TIGR03437 family)